MGEMKERMLRGELYIADDPDLAADFAGAQELVERYNRTLHREQVERDAILHELVGDLGEGVVIRPPFYCEYGTRVSIGARTFINYDCVMLDVAPITIGSACQIATRVQLLTATHPIDPEPRRIGWESAEPIVVGHNVWLGGGVIVCPGATIGDDTVVGAGAVVTRDLPAGVVAAGVPARVIREIGDGDRVDVWLAYLALLCIVLQAMHIDKDLVAASATPLVLAILAESESYGYAILKRVRALSGGDLEWTDGMLYPLLHRLRRFGYVTTEWRTPPEGRRRQYYMLTDDGRAALAEQRKQWEAVTRALNDVWRLAAVEA